MDKILKIVIYVAILFFVSIWISSVVKSCNTTDDSLSTATEQTASDGLDDFEEDFFEDNIGQDSEYDSDMGGGGLPTPAEEVDFDTNYDEIDSALEEKEDSYTNTTSTTTNTSTTTYSKPTASKGKYMVLAGSYLIKDNAESMIGKLKKLGYSSPEIVVFNMSQYHSVCASRSVDYNEAMRISNELKRKGIDNYVHTKH